jgi:RNA polymerase-interacting CarD/CdnL/TRCF family regulator
LVADTPKSFYHLAILDGSGGELFVPVDKVQDIGIRLLLKKSEIPKLLGKLMVKVELARDRRQRANDTLKRFTSGSAFDLAEVVESLTELGKTKMLGR